MMKNITLAVFGLAMALSLVSPSRANAGVIVGVRVGPVVAGPVFVPRPVFFPRPAYGYGYVAVHPRPYFYPHPYAYAPAYYHRFDRGWGRPYGYRGYWGRR